MPPHQSRVTEVRFAHAVITSTAIAAELTRRHTPRATVHPGIAVVVDDVVVVDHPNVVVDIRAVVAIEVLAIPGIEMLEGSQRHPAPVAEADADVDAAEAKPSHHRWTPPGAVMPRPRIPAPVAALIEPTAVMEGRPSELVVTHPTPAVVIEPDPTALAIRGPAGGHARLPNAAIGSRVDPGTVVIEFLGTDDVVGQVLAALGPVEFAIAAQIEPIPFVLAEFGDRLKFGIGLVAPHERRLAPAHALHTARRVDLGFAGAGGHLGSAVSIDGDAVVARLHGTHAHRRRVDVDVGG